MICSSNKIILEKFLYATLILHAPYMQYSKFAKFYLCKKLVLHNRQWLCFGFGEKEGVAKRRTTPALTPFIDGWRVGLRGDDAIRPTERRRQRGAVAVSLLLVAHGTGVRAWL
jgi:hypothetical protein